MTGAPGTARPFTVWHGDQLAMRGRAEAGVLASTSGPPPLPGTPPVTHPFATVTFFLAETEGQLGALLRSATELDGFLEAVAAAGYRVVVDDA